MEDIIDKLTFNEVQIKEVDNNKVIIILYCLEKGMAKLLLKYILENDVSIEIKTNAFKEITVSLKLPKGRELFLNTELTIDEASNLHKIIVQAPDYITVGYKLSTSHHHSSNQYKELPRLE